MLNIIIIVCAVLLVIYVASSFFFAWCIVHPYRQPITRTPADLGMAYEDFSTPSRDGLHIKGWYIPGTGSGLIIQTHPNPFNRIGFDPKKQGFPPLYKTPVDMLATTKVWHDAGYSVVCFDFRNAGTSDSGITGIGLNEWQDVAGVLDWINTQERFNGVPIGFASFCMGANSTIIAAARDKAQFERIACVLAVQPISAAVFTSCYMSDLYTPVSLVIMPLVNALVQLLGSYPIADMTPIPSAPELKCPALFLQARTDPWTRMSDIETIFNQTGSSQKELVIYEEQMGRFDTYNRVHQEPAQFIAFFDKWLRNGQNSV